MIDDSDAVTLGFEALFRQALASVPAYDDGERPCVLIVPYEYGGRAYECMGAALRRVGLTLVGTLDDRTALCMYVLEASDEIRAFHEAGKLERLIVIDALAQDAVFTLAELSRANNTVHVAIDDVQRAQNMNGRYYRGDSNEFRKRVGSFMASFYETWHEAGDASYVVLGDEFTTGVFWDALLDVIGYSIRAEGKFAEIHPNRKPYACAANLFASRFLGTENGSGSAGLSGAQYSFSKKYIYGLQVSNSETEEIVDLRNMNERDIPSISLRRRFLVRDATRDVFLNLRAGYGRDVSSTFCAKSMVLEKKKDFQDTVLDLTVGVSFSSAMQGTFTCESRDGMLKKSEDFRIMF
jgi:hypothetical protein